MSPETLNDIIKRIDALTADEQLSLAAQLIERARAVRPLSSRHRKWRDIRGLARPSLLGEDAQAWVSRTRREADEKRERELRESQ
jgi:lysophospholipase L1-like esterase